jgi:hypothetical protein
MTKNPLVPTTIVNKNGVTTTVHKRLEAKATRVSSIPKVSTPAKSAENRNLLVENIFASELDYVKMSPNVREKMMATLHEDTLPVMGNICYENEDDLRIFRKAASWSANSRHLALVNGYVALLNESESKNYGHQLDILRSLRGVQYCRPAKPVIDITNPNDPYAEGALALVRVLRQNLGARLGLVFLRSMSKDETAYIFKEPEVGTLIMEEPDRADEIVDLYRKYGHFNRARFKAALENNVQALNEGVL